MTTIVTRAGKGSALTYAEMDANFVNLNNDKLESGTQGTNIANTPSGNIAATNVQAAINELDTEKLPANATSLNGTTIPASKTLVVTTDIGSTVMPWVVPGANGNVLTSNGTSWISSAFIGFPTASQAEMEVGTESALRSMSPLRVKQAIDSLSRGTVLLGTLTTTSGSTQTLSGLNLTTYKEILISYNGVSLSGAGNIRINSTQATGSATAGTDLLTGWGRICLQNSSYIGYADKTDGGSSNVSLIRDTGITNASTSITFAASAGTFDAGSITIFGVR